MKKVTFFAMFFFAVTMNVFTSCTPDNNGVNNEQQIGDDEITDDDI